ncbi:uncharacterized protein LOC143859049 isoform X2 [Tasmannia lanceolata]|uniref:uncharacterized protein LOC143859049 isoform X2 n=1 Tax=Tasmannia lanceolata TaxID=3420 RepID=UPI0040640F18
MFRLSRHRSEKSGERIDFKFSQFQAHQVPKGWDKLFVSIISVETGKTVAKSSKAVVRIGNCQWTEAMSESIWVPQDDASKELEECLFKFVVSMGSARSGILGEAIFNLTEYMSSRDLVPVSLPLKKCNYGTTLHVKIQCLTPRTRDKKPSKETNSKKEDLNTDDNDMENKSFGSDNMFTRSVGSSPSNHLGSTLYPGESKSRDPSFSVSGSHHSTDSGEGSIGRTNLSPGNNPNEDMSSVIIRQDSEGSRCSAPFGTGLGDDFSKSNPSSFNSSGTAASFQNQWQEVTGQSSPHMLIPLSLRTPNSSSKDLLEAAEDTIEELRAEVKMWERNARKLKLDLEILRKEFSDQSLHQENLETELSAANTERDGLKAEIEQLKVLLDESMTKQNASGNSKLLTDDIATMQKEFEDEIKFQKESNANLALQMKKTRESNIELVSILQEMEETIEKQRLEIDNLSAQKPELSDVDNFMHGNEGHGGLNLTDETGNLHERAGINDNWSLGVHLPELNESQRKLQSVVQLLEKSLEEKNQEIENERVLRNQTLLDIEAEWARKLSVKEEEIFKLEAKLTDLINGPCSHEMGLFNGDNADLIKEIEFLNSKVQELERDCNELTDENLELIFKMKSLKKDVITENTSLGSAGTSELENNQLKSKIDQLELQMKEKERLSVVITEQLQAQLIGTQNKCTDLELELQCSQDKACNLSAELCEWQLEVEKKGMELTELQQQLESYQLREIDWEKRLSVENSDIDSFESHSRKEMSNTSVELCNQLSMELHTKTSDMNKELAGNRSEIGELKDCLSLKVEEVRALKCSQKELEAQLCNLQKEKSQLEENLEITQRESSIASKCFDDVRQDLIVLTSNMDSHVSVTKMLERKSTDLESGKRELEFHLSEMEEENVQLSERISGLEAQLRYFTDERESTRLELENSRCLVTDLQNEVSRLQADIETQKVELKKKLQETQRRWSEAQEESEVLKRGNLKLQSTAASLIEECNSLQKLNEELRRQRLELYDRSTHLDTELRETQKKNSDFYKKVELLEAKLNSMYEDFVSKETSLASELESLCQKHKEDEEKLILTGGLLNKVHFEKNVEIESLQREVVHLTAQISSTHDERERIASDAVLEVLSLRADKTKLESSLQEALDKIKLYETKIDNFHVESQNKVQELISKLAVSKQNEELLIAEREHSQRLIDDFKSSEEKFKQMMNKLELKLNASEYSRQQLMEEIASLKVQLQKVANLQDEILYLKGTLDETKFEKGKLESSLQLLSEECEELKVERLSYVEKNLRMQSVLSEAEDARRSRVSLEEKLIRLECDLTAREALCAHDAELKNELSRIKRTNSQFQRKIQCLEEEKDESLRRCQTVEKELKMNKEDKIWDQKKVVNESSIIGSPGFSEFTVKGNLKQENLKLIENGMHMNTNQHHEEKRHSSFKIVQLHEYSEGQRNLDVNHYEREDEMPKLVTVDLVSKIQMLESKLAEALDANDMYKMQLKGFLCGDQTVNTYSLKKSVDKVEVTYDEDKNKGSPLEMELGEMRERYFHMSLRYAEVEAEREKLVMEVKALKRGKGWFR